MKNWAQNEPKYDHGKIFSSYWPKLCPPYTPQNMSFKSNFGHKKLQNILPIYEKI